MARKPMTEEQKQQARERMKAKWAERKAGVKTTEPVQTQEKEESTKTIRTGQVGEVLAMVSQAREFMHAVRQQRPDMIEAVYAEDALVEAERKMGQVEGLI